MAELLTQAEKKVLAEARGRYGNKNQILVAIEELSELASILAKYGRYEAHAEAMDSTRNKVLDEVADVHVIMDHILTIYEFSEEEVRDRVALKVARVARWLSTSNKLSYTTVDREIGGTEDVSDGSPAEPEEPDPVGIRFKASCGNCWFYYHDVEAKAANVCGQCLTSNDDTELRPSRYVPYL